MTISGSWARRSLPEAAWPDSLHQDDTATTHAGAAELTGLDTRIAAWIQDLRLITRRTRPAAPHRLFQGGGLLATGWHYAIVATIITLLWASPACTIHNGSMRCARATPR